MSCGINLQTNENFHHLKNTANMSYRTQFDQEMYNKFCKPLGPCVEGFHDSSKIKSEPVKLKKNTQPLVNHHSVAPGANPHTFRTAYDQHLQQKYCPSCPKQHFYDN